MSARRSRAHETILHAARAAFTETGYDAATIRDVARRAGVDPALVHHYFGTKQQLFLAAIESPMDPSQIIERLLDGDVDTVGARMARTFLDVWDSRTTPMIALIRSATSNDRAAAMLREFMSREIIGRVAQRLGAPDPQLRASLVGSQLMGIALLRYVIRVEPLASASAADLADLIAPALQHYLIGDSPPAG